MDFSFRFKLESKTSLASSAFCKLLGLEILEYDGGEVLTRVHSGSVIGIDAYPVEVEVDVYPGLPFIVVVGLHDNAVKESTVRAKSAVVNSGCPFPAMRIMANLAPAAATFWRYVLS